MLKKGRLKILFATISHRTGGHWKVSINVEAAPLHPALCHRAEGVRTAVGIDRGLQTFAVLADAEGREVERIDAPRPLRRELPKLRRLSRSVSRKKRGSKNRNKAKLRLAKLHHRIGNVRRDFVHRVSSRLAKTHGHLVLETLSTAGMMRTRLARSLADSAWAMFAQTLKYKQAWRGGTVLFADRFYPSTRRCSACAVVGEALPLSERTFHCGSCGHEADRDTNAAVCLAQYPESWPHVAAKQAETLNVCREESAGAWARPPR
jgi:putative transposase